VDFFISDEHYGHSNIITFRHLDKPMRNFARVSEMNRYMIRRHNEVVTKEDTTYHLGDFMFTRRWQDVAGILEQLNGSHVLILGNHDNLSAWEYVEAGFQSVHTSLPWKDSILVHDPAVAGVLVDNFYIHGHTHAIGKRLSTNTICACVELWDYTPKTFEQLCQ